MSCQDFAPIIVELARERLIDAATRQRGLAHVETCAVCAALLAEERALSAGLRGLRAAVTAETAPVELERVLLTAFRQQQAAPVVAGASTRRGWWWAAAAVLLLSLGLASARWLGFAEAPQERIASGPAGAVTPMPDLVGLEVKTPVRIEAAPGEQPVPRDQQSAASPKRPRRTAQARREPTPQPAVIPAEYVTEFFPVARGSELIPLEGGQLVRVQMPRANLIPLGIPVNQERAAEIVKADVLVSHEGLARAIRLVY
jgi:hypothetical protein